MWFLSGHDQTHDPTTTVRFIESGRFGSMTTPLRLVNAFHRPYYGLYNERRPVRDAPTARPVCNCSERRPPSWRLLSASLGSNNSRNDAVALAHVKKTSRGYEQGEGAHSRNQRAAATPDS